jgi:hypothetical protein
MKIKSFKQFLNEFEIEGEHQEEPYKFLVMKNTKYDTNLYWVIDGDWDVDKFLEEKNTTMHYIVNKDELKLEGVIPRNEAIELNKMWVYFNKDFETLFFNPTTNKPF